MDSVKGVHSQTHDRNASECKLNDQEHEDLFGLALESAKCTVPKRKSLVSKSFKISDQSAVTKSASAQLKLLSKKAEKKKESTKVRIDFGRKTSKKGLNVGSKDSLKSKEVDLKSLIGKQSDTFVCKYCCRRFQSSELLHTHVIQHGSNPSYVCYVCGFEAQAFSSLMSHCVKHSREKNSQSPPKQDMHNVEVKSGVNSQNDPAISCSQCNETFSSNEKLSSHICSKTEKSEYNCTYCGHTSASVNDYRLHVISHSSNSLNPFYCLHCNFRGLTKKMLDKHYDVCKKRPKTTDRTVFRCKSCKSEFKHRKLLNRHMKMCDGTPIAKDDMKSCTKCNAQLSSDADYEEHILVCKVDDLEHSPSSQNSEPIVRALPKSTLPKASKGKAESVLCTRCGEFLDKRGYVRHRQACIKRNSTINENSVVLCPTCGDIFHTTVLEDHMKSCQQSLLADESEDELQVDVEGGDSPTRRSSRIVRRKESLSDDNSGGKKKRMKKKHLKNHALKVIVMKGRQSKVGKEIFKCIHCDLTFCSKSTLLRHKRMHSGNPYFSCKYCGKFFFRKDVYTRHEVNVHSKTSKTTFCCYYCKVYFGASGALRVHVFANHKSNAFLPIKSDLSDNNGQENSSLALEIKKEPENDSNVLDENIGKKLNSKKEKVKNSFKSDNSGSIILSSLKKCGSCSEAFFTEEEIEKHVLIHKSEEPPALPEIEQTTAPLDKPVKRNRVTTPKKINEPPEESSLDAPKIKRRRRKSTTPKTKCSISQPKHSILLNNSNAGFNESKILNSVTVSGPPQSITDSDDPTNAHLNEFDSDLMDITPAVQEESGEKGFICKLCSNVFSSEPLLKSHEDTMHKMMDWYKCLVCDTFGPKLEMIEHMFSHMFKVGTFVTNNDQKSLDSLIPSLLNQDLKLCGSLPASQNLENEMPVSDHNTEDEDMDFELPHLTDYGSTDCLPPENEVILFKSTKALADKNIKTKSNSHYSPENNDDESSNFSLDESNSQCEQKKTKLSDVNTTDSDLPSLINNEENSKIVYSSKEISSDSLSQKEAALLEKDTQDRSESLDDPSSENNKFSQLRYLLENFKKNSPDSKESSPNKEPDKANPEGKDDSKYAQLRHLLKSIPLNSLRNIKDNLNQINFSQKTNQSSDEISKESCRNLEHHSSSSGDYSKEIFPTPPVESMRSASHAENLKNQDPQTCLRSDVNQYRGEVREACPSLRAELESPVGSQMQGRVFDLSQLLLGESANYCEDYFQTKETLPNDQTLNQFKKALGSPQFSKSVDRDRVINKAVNYPCSVDLSPSSPLTIREPKNTVPFVTADTHEADLLSKTFNSRHLPKFFNRNYLCSVCDKPLRNGDELKLHYQNEHSSSTLPNNVCKSCYQTFTNSIECVKHFANCTKSQNRKNHLVDYNPKLPVTLQALLADDPSRPQSYSPASPDYETSTNDVFNTSALNLSHNPFNS